VTFAVMIMDLVAADCGPEKDLRNFHEANHNINTR